MERPTLILLGMAGLLAAGLGLSVYAGTVVFEDIVLVESTVSVGTPLEVTAPIPPGMGIFALDVQDYEEGMELRARVLGPLGHTMTSVQIVSAQYEGTFETEEHYEYTLVVESDSTSPLNVVGALGPVPDAAKTSLGFVSLYMLLVGMVGMIVSTIYMVWWRRRH
ncbi:MAG: hypothetical protein J4G04_03995 [Nitrosopumilaceae archaeon]|nr:hypothetical protein [Nitrosopumilaceae archaeon]